MRPLLNMGTDPVWQTRATWGAHVGTATAWHVEATGRAATGLLAIAERTVANKRRPIVSPELAARLRRRTHATKLLTQCHIPVGHTPAVDWIMYPVSPPIHVHCVIVEVVYVDDGYVAVRPIEPAEEETRTDADSDAPGETHPESRTIEIAGPGSPIDRWVRRPPPRPIHHQRIVVGNINHLRI